MSRQMPYHAVQGAAWFVLPRFTLKSIPVTRTRRRASAFASPSSLASGRFAPAAAAAIPASLSDLPRRFPRPHATARSRVTNPSRSSLPAAGLSWPGPAGPAGGGDHARRGRPDRPARRVLVPAAGDGGWLRRAATGSPRRSPLLGRALPLASAVLLMAMASGAQAAPAATGSDRAENPGIGTAYLARDHLGSTLIAVDGRDAPVARLAYQPWGPLTTDSIAEGAGCGMPRRRFGGKEAELSVDRCLYYFEARYYDACLGRFLSTDGARQFSDPYAYTAGDPLAGIDPGGNLELPSWLAVADRGKALNRGYKTIARGVLGGTTMGLVEASAIRSACKRGQGTRGEAAWACSHRRAAMWSAVVAGFVTGAVGKLLADTAFAHRPMLMAEQAAAGQAAFSPARTLFARFWVNAHLPYGTATAAGLLINAGVVSVTTGLGYGDVLKRAGIQTLYLYAGMVGMYTAMAYSKRRLGLSTATLSEPHYRRQALTALPRGSAAQRAAWAQRMARDLAARARTDPAAAADARRYLGRAYYAKLAHRAAWETAITLWLGTGFFTGSPALCAAQPDWGGACNI